MDCAQYRRIFSRVSLQPFPLFIFLFSASGIESGSCVRESLVIVDTSRRFTIEMCDYVELELLNSR